MENIRTLRPQNCWRCLRITQTAMKNSAELFMPGPGRGNKPGDELQREGICTATLSFITHSLPICTSFIAAGVSSYYAGSAVIKGEPFAARRPWRVSSRASDASVTPISRISRPAQGRAPSGCAELRVWPGMEFTVVSVSRRGKKRVSRPFQVAAYSSDCRASDTETNA